MQPKPVAFMAGERKCGFELCAFHLLLSSLSFLFFSPGHLLDALSDRIPDTGAGTYTRVGPNIRSTNVQSLPSTGFQSLSPLCALLVARHGQLSFSVSLFFFWYVHERVMIGMRWQNNHHSQSLGLFILCNAVICCVSVWNLALAEAIGWNRKGH